jgi:hypothetical protein
MISITSGFGFSPGLAQSYRNVGDLYQADDTYLTALPAHRDIQALDLCCSAADARSDRSGE